MATSHGLTQAGVEHVVLERGRVGETWRGRWDSFCLVTPNWTLQLPGHPYDGDDPDGFMPRRDLHYRTLRKAGVTLLAISPASTAARPGSLRTSGRALRWATSGTRC